MNKLNFKNQQKTLKILSSLCDSSRTGIISLPVRFEENFDFLDAPSLAKMLQILEAKDLIQVHYADYPDNFNIYTLKVTPKGLDFEPQISYDKRQKWVDRIWGFVTGALFSAIIQFLVSVLS